MLIRSINTFSIIYPVKSGIAGMLAPLFHRTRQERGKALFVNKELHEIHSEVGNKMVAVPFL